MQGINKIAAIIMLVLMTAITMPAKIALAQVPQTLNYQGYLTDSTGQALLDPVVVEFSIYTVETGGTPIWSEFQNIFPAQGLFSTSFGTDTNPFPANMFDTPLYLGVKVSVDPEMTPRTPLSASAYSLKADDAQTLGGLSPAALDQSSEVNALQTDLVSTQGSVTALESSTASSISSLQGQISTTQADVAAAQSDANDALDDISLLSDEVSGVQADVTAVENTLPTLQTRVSQQCVSGASIRAISATGSVTCEVDDGSNWGNNGGTLNSQNLRVGIGTTAAAASLQIDAPADVDPFRARVQSSTKLRVHANGSVSVGTSSAGTENGLYVSGDTGIGTSTPDTKLELVDTDWQFSITNNNVGGDNWFLGSSADAWAVGGGKFVIGPTTSSSAGALVIDSNRDVGIGVSDPQSRLQIGSGTDVNSASGGYLILGSLTGSNVAIDNNEIMGRSNGTAGILALNAEGGEVTVNSGGSRDNNSLKIVGRVNFDNGGNGGMRISATDSSPTNALFEPTLFEEGLLGFSARPFWRVYSREFYASSPLEYRTYSDRSVKSNVQPIRNALATIKSLEGVSYALKDNPMGKRARALTDEEQFVQDNQLGFIAQDVDNVLPQLVTKDDSSGLHTVAYMGVIPVLVEALKEQQVQLEQQRAEIDELRARLK